MMFDNFGDFFRQTLKELTSSKDEIIKFHARPYQNEVKELIESNSKPTFICWSRRLKMPSRL